MTIATPPNAGLVNAAARASEIGWGDLWSTLSRKQREEALRNSLDRERRQKARQLLAQSIVKRARGYSLNKLLTRPDSELARLGSTLRDLSPEHARDVLISWLIERHGQLQRILFETTGNAAACNERGESTTESFGTSDPAITQQGCDAVLASDTGMGLVYLLALGVGFADRWSGIHEILKQWAERVSGGSESASVAASEEPPVAVAVEAPEEALAEASAKGRADAPAEAPVAGPSEPHAAPQRLHPVPEPQLTILDDLLIKTILAAWAGAEHALSREELFALLDEVAYTNTERRRTNYHLGFADALFEEPWRDQLNARSDERRAWYAAGYLTGVARRASHHEVAECFDRHGDAQLLVQREWPPFKESADAILPALVAAQLHDTLARMAPIITRFSRRAIEMVGEQGRSALERRDPGMALAFLQPAVESLAERVRQLPPDLPAALREALGRLHHDLRRRLAHAYRLTGASEAARTLLESLLETESDDVIRGMIMTDLALIGAGLRELAEVHVPDDRARHAELASLFEPVEPLLYGAMPSDGAPAAHAAYVLGVVSLLRGEWLDAAAHLRAALDAFEARPLAYTGRGVLRLARLYTATAELLAIGEEELARRAAERLHDMIQAGERPPQCFLQELVGNALLVDQPIGEALVAALLDREVLTLDTLATFIVATEHSRVALAMCAAVHDEKRSRASRVDLAHRALPAMVRDGDVERIETLLAEMEDGAANGVGVDDYLMLLEQERELWEPCWDLVDAKWSAIRVYLSNGRVEQARDAVRVAFFAVVGNAQQRHDWQGEAEDLLEALRRSGGSEADVAELQRHLPAHSPPAPPVTFRPNARHTVLVVGGNEVQRRFEEELIASLRQDFGESIRVVCHTTGMTSIWNRQLEMVERLLPTADGVVISRFIRTNFGRNLRRQLGTRPWRTCGSGGMGRVRNLVVELAGELERRATGGE